MATKIAPNQQPIPTSVEHKNITISQVRYNSIIVVYPVKEEGRLREISKKKKGKRQREYKFSIFVDDHLIGITEPQSYGEIKNSFSLLNSTTKFPCSMFMKNTTTNEKNTTKRAHDIATYMQSVLRDSNNNGRISVHDALNVKTMYKDHCVSIFFEINALQKAQQLAVRNAQAARRLAIDEKFASNCLNF